MKATVEDHGSLALIIAQDDEAAAWIDEHVEVPDYMRIGPHAANRIAVEPRYAGAIIEGFIEAGGELA